MSFREKRQYTVERIIPGKGMLCFEITASPLNDATGNLIGGIEIVRDISERKEAEKAVRRAHAELQQIFNTAADGMRVIASDHTMIRANRTFSVLTGINEAEVIGKKCYDVFSGAACQTPCCPLSLIMGGEKYVEYEVEKRRLDGVTVPCILTATPFLGLDGELLGIVEDFRDGTERKEAEEKLNEERERLAVTLLSIGDGVIATDGDGRIHLMNKVAEELTGWTQLESFGKPLAKVFHIINELTRKLCESLVEKR